MPILLQVRGKLLIRFGAKMYVSDEGDGELEI